MSRLKNKLTRSKHAEYEVNNHVRDLVFEDYLEAFNFPSAVVKRRASILKNCDPQYYARFSAISQEALDSIDLDKELSPQELRAVGAILGMMVGDALGAPLEFSPVTYGEKFISGMDDLKVWMNKTFNKFHLLPGQWTDDGSMGLCLIDNLLLYEEFNPLDLRLRFLNWWELGYNNAFGHDITPRTSVGLGGSIGMSFSEFTYNDVEEFPLEYREATRAGSRSTSGNGSIMRMAGVPVRFAKANDEVSACDVAWKQSKTTHQGDEAAECVRLMTILIMRAINHPSDDPHEIKNAIYTDIDFVTPVYSVFCLANSQDEESHESNKRSDLMDRKWNWKDPNYVYCESRARSQPGYIGSYAMDGLAMALHCVWTCFSFSETVLKAVNMCGDADTVGSIAGQLAGSIYGKQDISEEWVEKLLLWDPHRTIEKRALLLFNNAFQPPPSFQETEHAYPASSSMKDEDDDAIESTQEYEE